MPAVVFTARLVRLWGLLVLFCPVSGHATDHLSFDPQVTQARHLIQSRQPLEALAILRPLNHATRTDITDIRFLIGLSAIAAAGQAPGKDRKTALLDEAIAALRTILINRPQFVITRERQKSNAVLNNYRRTRADLRFVRQF